MISNLKEILIKERGTLRGLKKCERCGHRSGMKAKNCKNSQCKKEFVFKNINRSEVIEKTRAIQLITKDDSRIYSIRVKDNKPNVRNFVKISDKIISSDEHSCIISCNAICYIDTCKYDSKEVNLSCKHVQHTAECTVAAVELKVKSDIFQRLIMSEDDRIKMWSMYVLNESIVPSVQRIDQNQFVVCSDFCKQFPAGLLHINYMTKLIPNIKLKFECDCKKKIISISPCNTIIIENDICNHLLLLSAALLSDIKLKEEFKEFTDYISSKYLLEESITMSSATADNLSFFNENSINENFLNPIDSLVTIEDGRQFLVNLTADDDLQISDIEFINTVDQITGSASLENTIESVTSANSTAAPATTDTIPSSNNINNFFNIDNNNIENLSLLSDCQIEFMDEFKLTDQVDLYQTTNDDFEFIETTTTTTTGNEFITSPITTEIEMNDENYVFGDVVDNDDFNMNFNFINNNCASSINTVNNNVFEHVIDVAKNDSIDEQVPISDIKKMNITQILRLLESHGVIINKVERTSDKLEDRSDQIYESEVSNLNYPNWLDSVIERINAAIDYNDDGKPEELTFSVYHNFFRCLRARFGSGILKRIPDVSEIIKSGKYRGLTKYMWKFHKYSIIKRIFTTANMMIAIEKRFTEVSDGIFRALTEDEENELNVSVINSKNSIKIKPTEFKTFLKVGPAHYESNIKDCSGFQITWIPNVLPKSKTGEMRIKFQFGHKKNNKVVVKCKCPTTNEELNSQIKGDGSQLLINLLATECHT